MVKVILLACLVSFGIMASASAAEEAPFLFDLMARQPYRSNLNKLLAKKPLPDWVKDFLVAGAGAAKPASMVEIAGKAYRLDHLCKVHDCAGHTLAVLWAPGGMRVWAALDDKATTPVLFGDPPPEQAKILADAARN